MKHLLRFSFLAAAIVFFANTSFAFINPAPVLENKSEAVSKPIPIAGMTVKDFLAITPKTYKEITGKKMNFVQKLSLKVSQSKMKKQLKKGNISESSFIDFKDPVNKWMWFWIFGWGIGLIFLFIPGIWIISWLFFLFGTISLIVWIIKMSAT